MRKRFGPDDLNQISGESLNRMKKSDLILLTLRLRDFGIELYERLNQDSSNSSRPPSTDSPYQSKKEPDEPEQTDAAEQKQDSKISDSDRATVDEKDPDKSDDSVRGNAGCQSGSQGFWANWKTESRSYRSSSPRAMHHMFDST